MAQKRSKLKSRTPFDRYAAYQQSVQSPKDDADFVWSAYRALRRDAPRVLREDFCGTFALCCHWAQRNPRNSAIGVDRDPEPLEYGARNNLSKLEESEQLRVKTLRGDVLNRSLPEADIACALNFSYFTFKSREQLGRYFANCYRSLAKNGLLVLDAFGGPACQKPSEERRRYGNLIYIWEQKTFDPISNHAEFAIHFKQRGGAVKKNCFTYDWRMWSIPEIRELLREAGFRESKVYRERDDRKAGDKGGFVPVEVGEPSEIWLVYIVGLK